VENFFTHKAMGEAHGTTSKPSTAAARKE
jgi:hypothetical protein